MIEKIFTGVFIFLLSSLCLAKSFSISTHLEENGVLLGPSEITIEESKTVDFSIDSKNSKRVSYKLDLNTDNSVTLTMFLTKKEESSETVKYYESTSFVVIPNGMENAMSFQSADNLPKYDWAIRVESERQTDKKTKL